MRARPPPLGTPLSSAQRPGWRGFQMPEVRAGLFSTRCCNTANGFLCVSLTERKQNRVFTPATSSPGADLGEQPHPSGLHTGWLVPTAGLKHGQRVIFRVTNTFPIPVSFTCFPAWGPRKHHHLHPNSLPAWGCKSHVCSPGRILSSLHKYNPGIKEMSFPQYSDN